MYFDTQAGCDENALREDLKKGKFDFIDLGAGTGASITHCLKKFSVSKGIGFDISPKKIELARQAGMPVILQDVMQLESHEKCVSFVSMLDFLEHLPALESAEKILAAAANTARDFLFIRHPNFDNDDYLASLGLKFTWSDWHGHKNMMTLNDYHLVFERLNVSDYVIVPKMQIVDTGHRSIVPITAPIDTIYYDENVHGPKELRYLNRPVYTQYDIFVRLGSNDDRTIFDRAILTSFDTAKAKSKVS